MRVLWFAVTPSLYGNTLYGGWVASLERIVRDYLPEIELGIAFEHTDRCFKKTDDRVTYYPMNKYNGLWDKLKWKLNPEVDWRLLKPLCAKVIEDFCPDIIHCFGSENPFGLVAELTKVPVVVHMQGFLNTYSEASRMYIRPYDEFKYHHYNPLIYILRKYRYAKKGKRNRQERRVMQLNKYFMGRTDWDFNIVKYFSPGSTYFNCPEAIRREIFTSPIKWEFHRREKIRMVTISSASGLKGNDVILRTAQVLKDMGVDFEWRVAGHKDTFKLFESMLGLRHENLHITLLGMIDAKQIVKELAEAEFYVHTAIIDNSPNSLCEAQLVGCPVVSTRVGGIPQLVKDGETGVFYPYNEPHTLAFTLMNLHNDESKLKSLSRAEIECASARHDEKALANRLQEIYHQIIEHKKK